MSSRILPRTQKFLHFFRFLQKLGHLCLPLPTPGEEPGASADICEHHLQLLPGRPSQLFCLPVSDAGLFPSASGEPGLCGPSGSRRLGPGSPGRPVGAGLPGALHTVRTRSLCVHFCVCAIYFTRQDGKGAVVLSASCLCLFLDWE